MADEVVELGIGVVVGSQVWAAEAWPRWFLGMPAKLVAAGTLLATLAACGRAATMPAGHWSVSLLLALTAALLSVRSVFGQRGATPTEFTMPLRFPLAHGTFCIAHGGGPRLNGHRKVVAQRGALDVVEILGHGRRTRRGLTPRHLEDYVIYGSDVSAPCSGRVVDALDGLADQVPFDAEPSLPVGNHVTIEAKGARIVLAHLQPGSVQVRTGEQVQQGQIIGRVGNSGRPSEPHLHVHAEKLGDG